MTDHPDSLTPDIEALAEAVHQAYLDTCERLGWPVKPENQVPYADLADDSKELDRASVRAVLATLSAESETLSTATGSQTATPDLTEVFRKALVIEHGFDWTFEAISNAAHTCARAAKPWWETSGPLTDEEREEMATWPSQNPEPADLPADTPEPPATSNPDAVGLSDREVADLIREERSRGGDGWSWLHGEATPEPADTPEPPHEDGIARSLSDFVEEWGEEMADLATRPTGDELLAVLAGLLDTHHHAACESCRDAAIRAHRLINRLAARSHGEVLARDRTTKGVVGSPDVSVLRCVIEAPPGTDVLVVRPAEDQEDTDGEPH